MGVLQASSTQNDYVAAFWLVCFAYFGLRLCKEKETLLAAPTGAALGLAILTKGTSYIYGLPFVIWFLSAAVIDFRKLHKGALITIAITLTLNSGHYQRNMALSGHPLAGDFDNVQSARKDLPAMLSNLSRNLVSNTWTPSPSLNELQYEAVTSLHTALGIDAGDPETSLNNTVFVPAPFSLHEDLTGNGLHTLLIMAALLMLLLKMGKVPVTAKLYGLALVSSFILFCFLLKWQPWITRLELPGFVLFSPLIAVALPSVQRPWVAKGTMIFVVLAAIPWLFYNESRPLLGEWSIVGADRQALYFVNNPGLMGYYELTARQIATRTDCSEIGVYGHRDSYEYPLWMLVSSLRAPMPRIEHINVENITGNIPLKDFNPCMSVKLFQSL
jgi:hypothetical protein